ncbi:hypothetical protein DSM104443_01128 [Usitatibacter rugosus]|uniref:Signal peptidase I n=1 Tax=Usitatibacter rugosus TaxID=2732067 RepID=A0A6M4GWV7_9PROT|nr:S24/S26 family peptidase [Usitatibacter rugosus]QJR10077.1 hypothetical protein DSM104443_01128 [Usitatibacter rugosus]
MSIPHAAFGAVLGFAVPGTGHLYLGRARRFLVVFAIFAATVIGAAASGAISKLPGFAVVVVAGIGMLLFSVIDSAILGFRAGRGTRPWYSRWYFLVPWIVATSVALMPLMTVRESLLGYGTFHVPSALMAPTIRAGDIVLADTWSARRTGLPEGTLVVVQSPETGVRVLRRIKWEEDDGTYVVTFDLPFSPIERGVAATDVVAIITAVLWSPARGECCKTVEKK